MKKIFSVLIACLMLVFVLGSCGKSGVTVVEAAASIDSLGKTIKDAPVLNFSASAIDKDINVNITLGDSIIRIDPVEDELFEFYMSKLLKATDANVINNTMAALRATEGKLVIKITDSFGETEDFELLPAKIKSLFEAKITDFNTREAKNQLADALSQALPNREVTDGLADMEFDLDGATLTYTFTFENYSKFKHLKLSTLGGRYEPALVEQFAGLGSMLPSFREMMKDLKINNIRVTYKAKDSDKDLSTAWKLEGRIF